MRATFTTMEAFNAAIVAAVKAGLTFEASEFGSKFVIDYTGGW